MNIDNNSPFRYDETTTLNKEIRAQNIKSSFSHLDDDLIDIVAGLEEYLDELAGIGLYNAILIAINQGIKYTMESAGTYAFGPRYNDEKIKPIADKIIGKAEEKMFEKANHKGH